MLYRKLKDYTLKDAILFEEKDKQFLALKKMYKIKRIPDNLYLFLIIANALISFQLSWTGENYWIEFSNWDWNKYKNKSSILIEFENLLKNWKNNRRFVNMKLKRLKKLLFNEYNLYWQTFFNYFMWNIEFYYRKMNILAEDLANIMSQNKKAKTIVFAVKMFSYGARNVFWYLEKFPNTLIIPLDSRLKKLYKTYVWFGSKKDMENYYLDLSKKLNIPSLHLDAILWVNYNKLIKNNCVEI